MKLLLASQGFLTKEIASEVETVVGKNLNEINIAIVNESYLELDRDKDKRWVIKELSCLEKYIGGRIDFIDFKRLPKDEISKRIEQADLIYFVGGKQNVLARIIREYDLKDIIDKMIKSKVIMGTSAGSIIWGKQIESETYFKERYNKNVKDIVDRDYGIVDFNIIPHYLRKGREKWNQEFLSRTLKDEKFPIYAINDNQMISYVDGKIRFIGGAPVVFGNSDNSK